MPAPEAALRRHDLVRADPSAWAMLLAGRPDLTDPPWLAEWAQRGWPLVVCRPVASDPSGRIALGLPLPPSAGKRRLALDLAPDALGEPRPPPHLSSVAASAPAAWRATIARLVARSPGVRVFGGLAWQGLTGLDYLSPASDLDLLWALPPGDELDALLADIAAVDAEAPMRLDGELVRADGAAVNWRELAAGCNEVLVKRLDGVAIVRRRAFLEGGPRRRAMSARTTSRRAPLPFARAAGLGRLASECLHLELETYPKPGLVSPVDSGAHADMDIALMRRSADALEPWFAELAAAGEAGADMARLSKIGIAAEVAMLNATGGVNAHRGAIFGLGLLAAAAGACGPAGETLGARVARLWGAAILARPESTLSHGGRASRRYGVGGARAQAAAGFPALYGAALPALAQGEGLSGGAQAPARVHALFRLIAVLDDTNLLHRGGAAGLAFARVQAAAFLAAGGVAQADWLERALAVHRRFVARNLSPGAAADLLAMALFVRAAEDV